MKISRFRWFLAWAALVGGVLAVRPLAAGDLARAKAKLAAEADSQNGSSSPQPTAAPALLDPTTTPLFESAARPTIGPAQSSTRYTPAPTTSIRPTPSVQRTYHNSLRAAPGDQSAAGDFARPVAAAAPSTLREAKPGEPQLNAPSASAPNLSTSTIAGSKLAPASQVAPASASPIRLTTPSVQTLTPSASTTATKPQVVLPTLTAPTVTQAKPVAPSTAPTTAAAPATTIAPRTGVPSSIAPRTSRVTDAAPVRTADPSQPGRLPPLDSDKEPGEPDHEQKMTIGRKPADKATEQLFESKEEVPLTPELTALKKRVQTALALYYQNWTLNTREHSPWEVMHAIIAYGVDTKLVKNNGETTTAIGHLCYSGICRSQPILTIRNGHIYGLQGPGVQGHPGQFLAILAQSYLQRDYPLYVGGEKYTLEDLIKAEQRDCQAGTELTFKLISLMHYLPSDATWTNFQGQQWSLDRLVREEIVQQIRGAACGGTHRLMGLSYAVRKREQRGEPIDGIYLEAKKYIDQYHKYTFGLQNPDGSFSTAWFVRREARNDIDRRMQTTGHILEWLCFSLSDEQLRDPRIVKAVAYVTDLLLNEHYTQWEVGHLGHGLHALQIYNERVFGGQVRSFEGLVTRKPLKTAQRPVGWREDGGGGRSSPTFRRSHIVYVVELRSTLRAVRIRAAARISPVAPCGENSYHSGVFRRPDVRPAGSPPRSRLVAPRDRKPLPELGGRRRPLRT